MKVYLLWYCTDMLYGVFSTRELAKEAAQKEDLNLTEIQEVKVDAERGCIH